MLGVEIRIRIYFLEHFNKLGPDLIQKRALLTHFLSHLRLHQQLFNLGPFLLNFPLQLSHIILKLLAPSSLLLLQIFILRLHLFLLLILLLRVLDQYQILLFQLRKNIIQLIWVLKIPIFNRIQLLYFSKINYPKPT